MKLFRRKATPAPKTPAAVATTDPVMIEALREVDAMLPGTPPVAPPSPRPQLGGAARTGAAEQARIGSALGYVTPVLPRGWTYSDAMDMFRTADGRFVSGKEADNAPGGRRRWLAVQRSVTEPASGTGAP